MKLFHSFKYFQSYEKRIKQPFISYSKLAPLKQFVFISQLEGKILTLFVYLAISAATSADAVGICKSPDVELPEVARAADDEDVP